MKVNITKKEKSLLLRIFNFLKGVNLEGIIQGDTETFDKLYKKISKMVE